MTGFTDASRRLAGGGRAISEVEQRLASTLAPRLTGLNLSHTHTPIQTVIGVKRFHAFVLSVSVFVCSVSVREYERERDANAKANVRNRTLGRKRDYLH